MAVTYGFFNSVNGDRKYNAEQMSEYFRGIINEGVYQHLDGGLAVTAGTGLAVNVAAGRAIIQNRWVQNSAAMSLTIAAASETYARKDAVVIRLNWSSRAISIAVKTGTPAASPVAPSMTRNSTTYEMALAYVNVAANATSVTVTDKRSDSTVCGWVTVAQSTSGEVDQMLNDMKTGFDGVTYPSPVEMVQGCDQKLQDEITNYAKHTHISFDPILFSAYDFYKKSNSISAGTTFSPYVECVTDYTAYNSATAGSSGSYGFRYKIADGLGPLKSSSNLKVTVIIKSSIARNVRLILSTGSNWNTNTAHIQQKDISITTGLNIIPVELTAAGNMDVTETRYNYFFFMQRSAYSDTADMEVLLFGSDVVANSLHNFETSSIINELKDYSENKRVSFAPILFKGYGFFKGSNSATLGANYEPFVERVTDYSAYNSATAGSSSTHAFTYMIADKYMIPKSETSVDITVIINSSVAREIKLYLSTAGSWNTNTVHVQTASFNVNVGINIIPLSLTPEGNYSTTATVYNHLIVEEKSNKSNTADFTIELYGSRDVGDILLQYQAFIPTANDYRLVFWGDSLTAGAGGGGTTYPAVCASELGNLSFFNGGVGGETANTIAARMGANSFILPAGNINGTYSIDAFKDDFGKDINPLRQGTAGVNPIKVNGVECELSISQETSTDPNATYTISGYSGNALAYDSFIECAGSHITGDITIIFVGQNGPSDLDERFAIIDSMIEKAATKKYVVLGISSGQDSNRSEMDAAYLKRYGGHLLLTRKMLVEFGLAINGLTPTAQDTADIEIGKVPESLRDTDDNIHLNAYGYTALGKILANKIRSLGYLD